MVLALLMLTGVRQSDVVKLRRQMVRGDWIGFTEAKGQDQRVKKRQTPLLPELRTIIEATPTGNMTFLVTEYGAPFTAPGFGNWFRDRCVEAGVPGRAHGLRKAGATLAAENGATKHQLMAIFGWLSPSQAAHYTKKANRKRLAGDPMHLLVPREEGEEGTELSHFERGVRAGGEKTPK
ncbi:MAG: tyrosine-type recombinase/integrase [Hyphomicrobiales bacterium]|nr:tyrosine-type recombinase/integrase [Hyphomicrobiales bacterium]